MKASVLNEGFLPQVKLCSPSYPKLGSLCDGLTVIIWIAWCWVGYYPEIRQKVDFKERLPYRVTGSLSFL